MPKTRVHNEYFRQTQSVRCPCGATRPEPMTGRFGEQMYGVWSWGGYVIGKWRTVDWFCVKCFEWSVKEKLLSHKWECGCSFNLVGYGGQELPAWLTLEEKDEKACQAV